MLAKHVLCVKCDAGSHGNVSQCSLGSAEGLDGHSGPEKPAAQSTLNSLGLAEWRTHTPVTRASSSPQTGTWPSQPQYGSETCSQPGSSSLDDITLSRGSAIRPPHSAKPSGRLYSKAPSLYPALRTSAGITPPPSSSTHPPGSPSTLALCRPPLRRSPGHQREAPESPSIPRAHKGPSSTDSQEWQREKWQICQLLSSDNADTLPETLV